MKEPIHDLTSRSTEISESEGTLKTGLSSKKKNLLIKKVIKDKKYGNKY